MRSDLKRLDSSTLATSKNHLIRNFLRNGRLRVNSKNCIYEISKNQTFFTALKSKIQSLVDGGSKFESNEPALLSYEAKVCSFQEKVLQGLIGCSKLMMVDDEQEWYKNY